MVTHDVENQELKARFCNNSKIFAVKSHLVGLEFLTGNVMHVLYKLMHVLYKLMHVL